MALTSEQKAFIERVGKLAAADMQKSGVLASLTTAQAILESGWGKSGLADKGKALFGIKAGGAWRGKIYSAETKECYDGENYTTIKAAFRAYDDWGESVADHSALLTGNSRYKTVVGERDYKAACRAIQAAGYATAPDYAAQLIKVIECYALTKFDKPTEQKGNAKMKASEFVQKLVSVTERQKTLYVMGCFGAPLTGANVPRYCTNHAYNKQATRTKMIKAAGNQNPPVFGFDCVGLIKGILWGWNGNAGKTYGGAVYAANGVPDIGADTMINRCSGITNNFVGILPGETVWVPGHIGVYIGGGKVVECSPAFDNRVQITACLNIAPIAGMSGRKWQKHGKLPYIAYDTTVAPGSSAGTTQTAGAANNTASSTAEPKMRVGARVQYSGPLYRDSAGNGKGKTVSGTYTVKYYQKGRKCGVHVDGLGWVPESACKVIS